MATTRRSRTAASGRSTTKTKAEILEIDFDDYEGDGNAYMGDDPRPGIYGFRLVDVRSHTSKSGNDGIRWTFECLDPAYVGWRADMYSNMDPDGAKFKTQQIVKAVQDGQEKKVSLNLADASKFLASCSDVVGRVISDSWEDPETGDVRNNSKLIRVVAESSAPKRKAKAEPQDDADDDGFDDVDGDDEGFDEDELRAELEGMNLGDLKKHARDEYGFTLADVKGVSKEELIDQILEEAEGEGGEEDDADADADSEDSVDDTDDGDAEPDPEPPARGRRGVRTATKTAPVKKTTGRTRRRG